MPIFGMRSPGANRRSGADDAIKIRNTSPIQLRKIIKTRGYFPNDEVAVKLIYLASRNITKEWKMSTREWKPAMN